MTGAEFMEHLVALVGHVAWPVTLLAVAILARTQIRNIIQAFADRVRDPASSIDITREGVHVRTTLEAAQAKIESLEIDQEQVKSMVTALYPAPAPPARVERGGQPAAEIPPQLKALADEYEKISDPDWAVRVRQKNDAAQEMASFCITNRVSRDALASQGQEGLIVGLAATVHAFPQARDAERLFQVARNVTRLHVKYRIVLALGRLIERKMLSPDELERVREILALYKEDADRSLARRIQQTEALMTEQAPPPPARRS